MEMNEIIDEYNKFIKKHVAITKQIKQLESSDVTAVRESARIQALDTSRWKLHRDIEELGSLLNKSAEDVRMDITSVWFDSISIQNGMYIDCYPADFNGNLSAPRAFINPKKLDFLGWEYTAGDHPGIVLRLNSLQRDPSISPDIRIPLEFSSELEERLHAWIKKNFEVIQDICLVPVWSHEGHVHTEMIGTGVFVPARYASLVLDQIPTFLAESRITLADLEGSRHVWQVLKQDKIRDGFTSLLPFFLDDTIDKKFKDNVLAYLDSIDIANEKKIPGYSEPGEYSLGFSRLDKKTTVTMYARRPPTLEPGKKKKANGRSWDSKQWKTETLFSGSPQEFSDRLQLETARIREGIVEFDESVIRDKERSRDAAIERGQDALEHLETTLISKDARRIGRKST